MGFNPIHVWNVVKVRWRTRCGLGVRRVSILTMFLFLAVLHTSGSDSPRDTNFPAEGSCGKSRPLVTFPPDDRMNNIPIPGVSGQMACSPVMSEYGGSANTSGPSPTCPNCQIGNTWYHLVTCHWLSVQIQGNTLEGFHTDDAVAKF